MICITGATIGPKRTTRWGALAAAGAIALSVASVGGLVAVGGCRQPAPTIAGSTPIPVDAKRLDGKWFIVASDQPTWTSGEKTSPALHYKVTSASDGALEMEDRVTFEEAGAINEYRGRDTQEAGKPGSFNWRGSGALSLVSTRWHLMHMSPDGAWAVTFYEKTMATPAGVAIISRTPTLSATALAEARELIASHSELRDHERGLKQVAQTGGAPVDGS